LSRTAEVVICGAGIAGAATAHALAVDNGVRDIVLVDERPPLTLTSDKSTEAYRNWWPGPDDAMLRLMNRSIDRLEDIARRTDNRIRLDRRGYLYATADPKRVAAWLEAARNAEAMGAGPLRIHTRSDTAPESAGLRTDGSGAPDGADLFLEPRLLQRRFPFLSTRTIAALHPRRCGWFSGQQLGMYFLEEATMHGVELKRGRVTGVSVRGNKVREVHLATPGGSETIATERFVVAAGPFASSVAALCGIELPLYCELHRKMALEDKHAVVRAMHRSSFGTMPSTCPGRRKSAAASKRRRRCNTCWPNSPPARTCVPRADPSRRPCCCCGRTMSSRSRRACRFPKRRSFPNWCCAACAR
jgi:glycine/D-amino acid oxidase-like deaminating enzyme